MRVTLPTDPDQVRGVDVGYLTAEQVRRIGPIPPGSYAPEAPALIAEAVSPSESATYLEDKLADYFAAGAHVVWLLFPGRGTVRVCLPDGSAQTVSPDGMLQGGALLPGFALLLRNLFPEEGVS